MARITHLCAFSNDTIDFLMNEIDEIIKHCDIADNIAEELGRFSNALNVAGSIALALESPPYDDEAA